MSGQHSQNPAGPSPEQRLSQYLLNDVISHEERMEDWRGEDEKMVTRRTGALSGFLFIPGMMLRWLLTRVIIWDLHHELCVA